MQSIKAIVFYYKSLLVSVMNRHYSRYARPCALAFQASRHLLIMVANRSSGGPGNPQYPSLLIIIASLFHKQLSYATLNIKYHHQKYLYLLKEDKNMYYSEISWWPRVTTTKSHGARAIIKALYRIVNNIQNNKLWEYDEKSHQQYLFMYLRNITPATKYK